MGGGITGFAFTDVTLVLIILANATFFLYVELYTETDAEEMENLRKVHGAQWVLRVVNQANLTLTWIWLEYGLMYSVVSLLLFYILILAWDAIVFRNQSYIAGTKDDGGLNIVVHDLIGLGTMFTLFAFVFYFQSWDSSILQLKTTPIHDAINSLLLLNSFLFIVACIFVVNVSWVIKKAPIDLSELISNRRRF